MPLRSLGNMYFGGQAFGDPTKAFRAHAPPGILDQFEPERQAELGKNLQRQLRSWTPSRRGILNDFREGLLGDVEMRSSQQKAEEEARMREGVVQGLGVMHEQGLLSDGGYQAAINLPLQDQSKIVQEYFKGANVGATDTRFFGSSQIAQGTPAPFTLSPGQARFDGENSRQVSMPTTEQMNAAAGLGKPDALALREREIARLVAQGVDPQLAERVADGHVRVVTDPVTGRTSVVDVVDGRGSFVQTDRPSGAEGVPATLGPTSSVTPGVDVQTLTEIPGAARRLANKVSDVIGLGPVSQPTAEAAADMRQWYQLGRLRLASAITDDRRSNMVLEMLDDVFINPDKLFMGGEDTLLKLESLDRSLGQISSEFDQVLGNPYSSSVKDVQSAENRKRMIDSVREDIRVMVEGYGQRGANVEGAPPAAGTVQDGYQFLGGNPADPSRWRKVQ